MLSSGRHHALKTYDPSLSRSRDTEVTWRPPGKTTTLTLEILAGCRKLQNGSQSNHPYIKIWAPSFLLCSYFQLITDETEIPSPFITYEQFGHIYIQIVFRILFFYLKSMSTVYVDFTINATDSS
jgi:hypothetical protein